MSRIAQVITILALLASSFSLGGCTTAGPAPPINLELSFPNGAPRLNQTAELRCLVKSPAADSRNVAIIVNLPDGIQHISDNLSTNFGTIPRGEVRELKVRIKPARVGNYTIEARLSSGSHAQWGRYNIYLSVSENSAEWGKYPPWQESSPDPFPPPENLPTPPSISPYEK